MGQYSKCLYNEHFIVACAIGVEEYHLESDVHSTSKMVWLQLILNTLPPDSCEHCPHPVDRTFKLSTLQLRSTVRVPLNEHNFSQYKHI